MPSKHYLVKLSVEERTELESQTQKGKSSARVQTRIRILLLSDEGVEGPGWQDGAISEALGVNRSTVERTRRTCVLEGIDAAIHHKRPCRTRSRILDGVGEAHLIRLACSTPPRWA